MWMPETEQDITDLVRYDSLTLTTTFAARRELPAKNRDLAADIAAMANDGGIIIYGIDARYDGTYTRTSPVELIPCIERIGSVIATSIAEPPQFTLRSIPTSLNPAVGYLVLALPASLRAPHMVIAEGDHRFYGRVSTGVSVLPEGEVARLYGRRLHWEQASAELHDVLAERYGLPSDPGLGYLHLGCRPLLTHPHFLDGLFGSAESRAAVNEMLARAAADQIASRRYGIDFPEGTEWKRHPEGWMATFSTGRRGNGTSDPGNALLLWLMFDGSAYLFWGRGAKRMGEEVIIFDSIIATLTLRLVTFLGLLYRQGGYFGPVSLQLRLTNVAEGISYGESTSSLTSGERGSIRYEQPEFTSMLRAGSGDLYEDPRLIASRLVDPLARSLRHDPADLFDDERMK